MASEDDWDDDEVEESEWFSLHTGTRNFDVETYNLFRSFVQKRVSGRDWLSK